MLFLQEYQPDRAENVRSSLGAEARTGARGWRCPSCGTGVTRSMFPGLTHGVCRRGLTNAILLGTTPSKRRSRWKRTVRRRRKFPCVPWATLLRLAAVARLRPVHSFPSTVKLRFLNPCRRHCDADLMKTRSPATGSSYGAQQSSVNRLRQAILCRARQNCENRSVTVAACRPRIVTP